MIVIACTSCGVGVRTFGEHAEVHHLIGQGCDWYPNKYPCPNDRCGRTAEYMQSIDPSALSRLELHDLTPQESFAAFNGLGFPLERDCGETAVRELLLTSSICKAGTRQVRAANRTVVEWLEFEDGSRVYLASSADGAIAYRISRPHSYVEDR